MSVILAVIVGITLIVLLVTGIRNDFSIKKFFEPEGMAVTVQNEDTSSPLPLVSGKKNILVAVTDDDNKVLYYSTLVQVDMDSVSYKAATFLPDSVVGGSPLNTIYNKGGIKNTVNAVNETFSVTTDYYVVISGRNLENLIDDMGKVIFTVTDDIKYRDTESKEGFSLRMSAGEQNLSGKNFVDLIRYYIDEKHDIQKANEMILKAFSDLINAQNYAKSEEVFKTFISYSITDITVKDFSTWGDALAVLSDENAGVNVYSVNILYGGKNIKDESKSKIKSYFSK